MMQQLRESTKVVMVIVAIAFVGLMVFEWGMDLSGTATQATGPNQLGSVNGTPIEVEEYQRQYQILSDQAQQQAGDQGLSAEQLDQIEEQAWDDVVSLTLLQQQARRLGLDATEREIIEYIRYNPPPDMRNLPAFQTDGRFDLEKYQQALAEPSLAPQWARYEEQIRSRLPILKLQEQVVAGVTVSEEELLDAYRERNEQARIAYLHLDPDVLVPAANVEVTDEEVRATYEENRDDYRRAPSAKIRYVAFRPPVTPADSARAKALADSIAELARSGEKDFEDLAERYSDDGSTAQNGGDLGFVDLDAMDPAFAEAARGLEEEETSDPALTPFGWHVIQYGGTTEQRGKTLHRLRHVLIAIEPSSEAVDAARDEARAFARGASESSLEEAAAEADVEVNDPPLFEEGVVVPGLGAAPPVAEFAFANDAGSVSGPLRFDGAYFVVKVDERYPAGYIALSEVAPRIRERLLREKQLEAVREMAPEIARVVADEGLEGAADRYGLEVRTSNRFTRTNNITGIGSGTPVAGAAFGLATGQTAGPIETERGLYFIRLIEKDPYDPARFEQQKETLRQQLGQEKVQRVFASWFESVRERADVDDNRAQILGT